MVNFDTDKVNFLSDFSTWNEIWVNDAAVALNINLCAEHWQIFRFARSYYIEYADTPLLRAFIKYMHNNDFYIDSIKLSILFPYKTIPLICYLSGLPKPRQCF